MALVQMAQTYPNGEVVPRTALPPSIDDLFSPQGHQRQQHYGRQVPPSQHLPQCRFNSMDPLSNPCICYNPTEHSDVNPREKASVRHARRKLQNRNAQRAYRARQETHMKEIEEETAQLKKELEEERRLKKTLQERERSLVEQIKVLEQNLKRYQDSI